MASRTAELREMDDDELDLKLTEARQELFNLRFQVVTGRLDNTARIGQVRRQVARILSVQREREIEAAEALAAGAADLLARGEPVSAVIYRVAGAESDEETR